MWDAAARSAELQRPRSLTVAAPNSIEIEECGQWIEVRAGEASFRAAEVPLGQVDSFCSRLEQDARTGGRTLGRDTGTPGPGLGRDNFARKGGRTATFVQQVESRRVGRDFRIPTGGQRMSGGSGHVLSIGS